MGTVQTTASVADLERAVAGDFNAPATIDTAVEDTLVGLDIHHRSQQGLSSPAGLVVHNYTDGRACQYDNVGTGTILTLKNAYNPSIRVDEGIDYVGTGNFLYLQQVGVDVDGTNEVTTNSLTIKNTCETQVVTPASTPIYQKFNKVDDGSYAWHYYTKTVDHVNLFSLNSQFTFKNDYTQNRNIFTSLKTLVTYAGGAMSTSFSSTLLSFLQAADFWENIKIRKGITDKNGSTGTVGQVLTANGDGTCQWI